MLEVLELIYQVLSNESEHCFLNIEATQMSSFGNCTRTLNSLSKLEYRIPTDKFIAELNDLKKKLDELRRKHEDAYDELKRKHAREETELLDASKNESDNAVKNFKQEYNSISSEIGKSKKLIQNMFLSMKRKFEDNQDSVPECPLCLVEMVPPLQIYQCVEGHLVCSECRPRVNPNGCATCRDKNGYTSRNRYVEEHVRKRMHSS